jgi:hypothetical protein
VNTIGATLKIPSKIQILFFERCIIFDSVPKTINLSKSSEPESNNKNNQPLPVKRIISKKEAVESTLTLNLFSVTLICSAQYLVEYLKNH